MDIFFQKTLYRILRGRLRFRRDDLVLIIKEPSQELLYDSFEIYDEAYEKAYFNGVYVKDEIIQVLMEQRLWSPFDDRECDDLEEQIEDLKVTAFRSFYRKKSWLGLKDILELSKKS